MGNFEVIDHTADWALRVFGRDLGQLLLQAALGTAHLLVSDLSTIPLDREERITLDSFDAESLLVDFLTELAYYAEKEQVVFHDFALLQVSERHVSVVARGGRVEQLHRHIKAVTFHDLAIRRVEGGLEATIVFDV